MLWHDNQIWQTSCKDSLELWYLTTTAFLNNVIIVFLYQRCCLCFPPTLWWFNWIQNWVLSLTEVPILKEWALSVHLSTFMLYVFIFEKLCTERQNWLLIFISWIHCLDSLWCSAYIVQHLIIYSNVWCNHFTQSSPSQVLCMSIPLLSD